MKALLGILVAVFFLGGCSTPPAEPSETEKEKVENSAPAEGGSGSGGVNIVSPAAGGISPVTNTESVGGAGMGGVGQAAKDQAKRKAGGSSAGSLGQLDQSGDE